MNTKSSGVLSWLLSARAVLLIAALMSAYLPQTLAGQSGSHSRSKEKPYALIYGTVYGPDKRGLYGVKNKIRPADEKKAKLELYSHHPVEISHHLPSATSASHLLSAR